MKTHNFGYWQTPDEMPAQGAVLLDDLAVVRASGADAESFLHGQFTNHINALGNAFRLAAYCQPQGRILALMRVFKLEEHFYLILPRDLLAGFLKRLSMFILRSRVKLEEATDLKVMGLINLTVDLPTLDTHTQRWPVVARVADFENTKRAMAVGTADQLQSLMTWTMTTAHWYASDIAAGIPWVCESTKEAFVPQWINLDLIGGLVFDKGCYPGQEVISRVQHIGKTPRRMASMVLHADSEVIANTEVKVGDAVVGNVVMASSVAGKTYCLVEATTKALQENQLFINGDKLMPLTTN